MAGIRGRAAVTGVGCTRFAEHWDSDQYDLLARAVHEAVADAGVGLDDIQAAWLSNYYPFTGSGGATLTDAVRLYGKPVTRVENFCASGMDAFRNACLAVASGVYDLVLACGVEKITDQGAAGLPLMGRVDPVLERPSAPGYFALAGTRACHEWGWTGRDLAEVAVKNHQNGAEHPNAHFRQTITIEDALDAPEIASPLRRFDCCAVSDGAAAVVVASPDRARELAQNNQPVTVLANQIATFTYHPTYRPDFDFLGFPSTRTAARGAYQEASISDPVADIDLVECHDCFTVTELLNMQDLGLCSPGDASRMVAAGDTQVDGKIPVNASGGLKCFGHPIGATGVRMITEITRQLQHRALGKQVRNARIGLAHNLGGPGTVAAVTILGRDE